MPGEEESKAAGYQQPTKASQGQKAKGKSARRTGKSGGGRGSGKRSPSHSGLGNSGRGQGDAASRGSSQAPTISNTNPHGSFKTLFDARGSNQPLPKLKTQHKSSPGDQSARSMPLKVETVTGNSSPHVTPQKADQLFNSVLQDSFGGHSPQLARARYDQALESTKAEAKFRLPHSNPPKHIIAQKVKQEPGPPCFPASENSKIPKMAPGSSQDDPLAWEK